MSKVTVHANAATNTWSIANERVECRVQWQDRRPVWSVSDKASGRIAMGPSEFPQAQFDGQAPAWDGHLRVDHAELDDGSTALRVALGANVNGACVTRHFQVWPDQPFVRTWATIDNGDQASHRVTRAEILRVELAPVGPLTVFHVDQFNWTYRRDFFSQHQYPLVAGRAPMEVRMGSFPSFAGGPSSCAWFAARDGAPDRPDQAPNAGSGFVAGIEFNGKSRFVGWAVSPPALPAEAAAEEPADSRPGAFITSTIDDLNHILAPSERFEVPACFVGLFTGDWDEAGYVTQRFAEARVHPPMPDERYPWVQYNSWGYGQAIDEAQQLAAIERCAAFGVEAVVLDQGWATQIGDWRAHPTKFPHGIKPLSDRAHALGMRFGLHISLAEANVDSPIARENPDWLADTGADYFGAAPICLGHRPYREWLIEQIVRLIDDYGVDYFLQDGEDMVKRCEKATHTHAPGNSNYANSTLGLDEVISRVRRLRPQVVWENCEDGGCMLTYKMARLYHTTITVDNIATYATRQGVYGASYPFSPRYSVRYMQDDPTPYTLRSAIFGGPLILMQRVTEWTPEQVTQTQAVIAQYKELRALVRDAKIIHLLPPRYNVDGKGWGWDAIQAVSADRSRGVVMVYRAMGDAAHKTIRLRGLRPDATYRVQLIDAGTVHELSGADLVGRGIELDLPEMASEIIRIDAGTATPDQV